MLGIGLHGIAGLWERDDYQEVDGEVLSKVLVKQSRSSQLTPLAEEAK